MTIIRSTQTARRGLNRMNIRRCVRRSCIMGSSQIDSCVVAYSANTWPWRCAVPHQMRRISTPITHFLCRGRRWHETTVAADSISDIRQLIDFNSESNRCCSSFNFDNTVVTAD